MRNYSRAPEYKFGRLITADDASLAAVGEDWGWNFQHYQRALFHIIPIQNPPAAGDAFFENGDLSTLIGTPTSNPAVQVFIYSRAAKLWMKHDPDITFAAPGAGVAREIDFDAYGRRVGLKITGVSGGQGVVVLASAYFRNELE